MCDFSSREGAMVIVRPNVACDPCLVPLVRALYENGFPTVASCCGHGRQPANVALADGRQVFVADPEWAEEIWRGIVAKRERSPFLTRVLRSARPDTRESESPQRWAGVANIAWCPEHGLHGARDTCFECGKPVEQIPMVPVWAAAFAATWADSGEGEQ